METRASARGCSRRLVGEANDIVQLVIEVYGLLLESDLTPSRVDFVVPKPVPVEVLARVLKTLANGLRKRGHHVIGGYLELRDNKYSARVFVAVKPGAITSIAVYTVEQSSTMSIHGSREHRRRHECTSRVEVDWRYGVEDWEKPYIAGALYMVDPRSEDEVFRDMARLVGREEAERIASLVWRICFGEGYTLDEWARLLESLSILSPWECVWRFQELAGKGLRRKHDVESASLNPKTILRYACKHMGTG